MAFEAYPNTDLDKVRLKLYDLAHWRSSLVHIWDDLPRDEWPGRRFQIDTGP
jgi:hypothetical protein